jgi:uncharacterized MAPEG superfamily protein
VTPSILALLGFAAWTLVLLLGIAVQRSALTLSGARAANSFGTDGTDVSPFSNRLCRAHANCCENLPIFAAIVLGALASGRADVTDPLALWVLVARIGQSTTHLISTSSLAVQARFGFFAVQIGIEVWWLLRLLLLG